MVKSQPANAGDVKRSDFDPWVGKIPWRRKWQATPVFLPGESHGWMSLVHCGSWGCRVGHNWACMHAHSLLGSKLRYLALFEEGNH